MHDLQGGRVGLLVLSFLPPEYALDNLKQFNSHEIFNIPAEVVHGQDFTMEFFDEDDRRDDEFLGRAKVQTAAVAERGEIQGFWVDLEECETGKAQVWHFLYYIFLR